MRASSPGAPKPGRRHQPHSRSHASSCSGPRARRIDSIAGVGVQRELDELIQHEMEDPIRDLDAGAVAHGARRDAQRSGRGAPSLDADVVGTGRAAADLLAETVARQHRSGCAVGHGGVERRGRQQRDGRAVPARQHRLQALDHGRRVEHAAVEQQQVGARQAVLYVGAGLDCGRGVAGLALIRH